MMFTHKNLMMVCCAAVLAFGLAACGSSDNRMPAVDGDTGDTGDTAATATPATLATPSDTGDTGPICDAGPSQACVDARQTELDAIEADDDATVGDLNAAQKALDDAQTALSGANAADTVSGLIDDAVTATADIDDESTPAAVAAGRAAIDAAKESLDGMENLSADATAALQGRIDALDAGYSPIEMTVDTNADTAAAATKRTEIGEEAAQMTDAGLGGTGAAGHYRQSRMQVNTTWPSSTARPPSQSKARPKAPMSSSCRPWTSVTDAPCTLAPWMRMPTATWLKKS